MKKLSLCLMLLITPVFADDVILSWSLNPKRENIENYSIYKVQGNSGKRTLYAIVSNTETNLLVKDLSNGTHYFSITANNAFGSSRPVNIKINIKNEKNSITNRNSFNP